MDQETQGQNMDGIKPNEGPPPSVSIDGFIVSPKPPAIGKDISARPDSIPTAEASKPFNPQTSSINAPVRSKLFNPLCIVLLILLLITLAAVGFFYMQNSSAKSDLAAEQNKSANSTKQQATDKSTIDSLNTQVKTQTETVNTLNKYIIDLTKVTTQLKSTCGSSCKNIVIPTAPVAQP